MGRPNVPPPSRKDGKRRSGDYLLGAQRIKADVATRPGDYLNGADIRLAEGWMDTALQPVPAEIAQMGTGGELIPVGNEGGALVLRNTVEHPHYVTADASRDRLDLASKAGVLELALDAVETIQGKNSLEKMLAQRDRRRPPGFIPPCQPVVAWGRQKTRRLRELKPAG
jgi:hypothetical protein